MSRVGVLLLLAAGSSCPPPVKDPGKVVDCSAKYNRCVDVSTDPDQYAACRANVDAECLSEPLTR